MIEVICGPMFSGKTEELIRRLNRLSYAKVPFLLFKSNIDNRYDDSDKVVSHNKRTIKSIPIGCSDEIFPYVEGNPTYKTIAVDEIQFLDARIIELCKKLDPDYRIIVAGLDMDSNGDAFYLMEQLLPMADHVKKLSAVCVKCGKDAKMSYKITKNDSIVDVGGKEKYEARCIECWSKQYAPN